MDNEYAVMLTGTLVTGRAPTEVKQTLAGLFSISLEEIDSLLSKAPVRIKQNVDQDTARRYKVAVEKAGGPLRCRRAADGSRRYDSTRGGPGAARSFGFNRGERQTRIRRTPRNLLKPIVIPFHELV